VTSAQSTRETDMKPVINLIDRIVDLLSDPISGVFVISLVALLAVYSMATLVKER